MPLLRLSCPSAHLLCRQLSHQTPGLSVSVSDGVRVIRINRPDKYNALDRDIYTSLPLLLREAAEDGQTVVTAITGTGRYNNNNNHSCC